MRELVELTPGFAGIFRWQEQYFEDHTVPDDVVVSLDDSLSWVLQYPHHRWVYNKMLICETQGLAHGPNGTVPDQYPVFSKPMYNMNGMATGSRLIADELAGLPKRHRAWSFLDRCRSSRAAMSPPTWRWRQGDRGGGNMSCHRCAS